MEKKSEPLQYIPVSIEGKDFPDFVLPADYPEVQELLATSNYLGLNPKDRDLLEESIFKLFKEVFDIDIITCSEGEWAERITIKGGTLNQWQSFTKVMQDKKVI